MSWKKMKIWSVPFCMNCNGYRKKTSEKRSQLKASLLVEFIKTQ